MATTTAEPHTRTEKGISLARGPALILGTILEIAGLYLLYKQHVFPPFSHLPSHHVPDHKVFFKIFGANGWTGMLTTVAGGLLLFGAAQHLLAKTMSLIVAVGLGAAAVIALIQGNVLGMAAANIWTEIGWLAATAALLFNTIVPRRTRTVEDESEREREPEPRDERPRTVEREPVAARQLAGERQSADPATPRDGQGNGTSEAPADARPA